MSLSGQSLEPLWSAERKTSEVWIIKESCLIPNV